MPVARYFLFVGAALLALLFALDGFVPQQVAVASNAAPSIDKTVVRIRSDQKLPERVVYDTSLPTIVPPAVRTQIAAAPAAPSGPAVFPNAVDPKYAKETAGKGRMHTCVDQYNANKTTNGNGGMKWIEKGGGYYSECNKKLKPAA